MKVILCIGVKDLKKETAKMTEIVVVSGACGFVGRHLIETLIREGWNVAATDLSISDHLQSLHSDNRNNIVVFKADFTDRGDLKYIYESIKAPCYLVHLGGYILGGSEKIKQYKAQRSIDTNIKGSYNLVKVLKPKLSGVCLASTLDVYGEPKCLPINENHPTVPNTFYAASKLAMELYTKIELEEKIPLTILRFSHVYGAGDPHQKVLSQFVNTVRSGNPPIIYGDGSDLRDYIHVEDIVRTVINTMRLKRKGVFNVATGNSFSLKQLAELVIKVSGKKLTPVYMECKQARKDYSFDISKIKDELDFSAQISIEQGIVELME